MKNETIRVGKYQIIALVALIFIMGLVAGLSLGMVAGHREGVRDVVAIAKQQAQEKQAAEAAKQEAKAQERLTADLKSEKLDEFLGGVELRRENLAVMPFITGEVQLKSRSFLKGIFNSRYAIISPDDLGVLLARFESKWKVKVTSHILEPKRVIVGFVPAS